MKKNISLTIIVIVLAVILVFVIFRNSLTKSEQTDLSDTKQESNMNFNTNSKPYKGVFDFTLNIPNPLRASEVRIFNHPELGEIYQINYDDPQYDNLESLSVPYSIKVTVADANNYDASYWSKQYLFSGSEEITNIFNRKTVTINGEECVQQFEMTKENAPTEQAAMQMTYCIHDSKLFCIEALADDSEKLEKYSSIYDDYIDNFIFVD